MFYLCNEREDCAIVSDKPHKNKAPKYLDSPLRLLAVAVEAFLEKVQRAVRIWQGRTRLPLTIKKHNALRLPGGVILQGRVLAARRLRRPRVDDSAWVNLGRMLRHWLAEEEPYALVEAQCAGVIHETTTNEDGYFEVFFDHPEAFAASSIEWRLPYGTSDKWRRTGILVANPEFEHLVISDVDDTIIQTNAISIWKMVRTTLFGNVLTRQVFPGVSEFYRTLGGNGNPFFYVTSSPWNLRGFLQSVFERNELPKGGFFMTHWHLDKEGWFAKSHRGHKSAAIRIIFDWYPGKPAVLIGDNGQKDPEIYHEVAANHPGRVRIILIRDVTRHPGRRHEVEAMAEESRKKGIPFFVCHTTEEMEAAFGRVESVERDSETEGSQS